VWKNTIDGWLGRRTAAGPILGPEPPERVRQEPIKRPTAAELPERTPDDGELGDPDRRPPESR
jgi:hypothetical protein